MRRISILAIIFLLSFFLSATAGPSVPFNLVFNKQNENVLTFTDKEPGPEAASETVGEISSVSFPSLMSAADYDNYRTEGVLPAEIAAYWDVYGKGVTIYLTFGSGEYMLMNSDLSSDAGTDYQKGYNYNVTISSTRQDSINSGAIGTIKAEDYKLGQRIYLVYYLLSLRLKAYNVLS